MFRTFGRENGMSAKGHKGHQLYAIFLLPKPTFHEGWIDSSTPSIKSRRPQVFLRAEVRAERPHEQNRCNLQALARQMNFPARLPAQAAANSEFAGKNTCVYGRGEQQ